MIFQYTAYEKGLWRGWLKNGQSVEISWRKRGWEVGAGVHIHSNDDDLGSRLLFLEFWKLTVVLPLGITEYPWPTMEGPQWSIYASKEFGFGIHWRMWRKAWSWPWDIHSLAYEVRLEDGTWISVFKADKNIYKEQHLYTYILKSGEIQERIATISKHRHVLCRNMFKLLSRFKWFKWIKESINIEFNDEIGERSGSWKGGCIGCSYDLRKDETMLDALRRMENERKF